MAKEGMSNRTGEQGIDNTQQHSIRPVDPAPAARSPVPSVEPAYQVRTGPVSTWTKPERG